MQYGGNMEIRFLHYHYYIIKFGLMPSKKKIFLEILQDGDRKFFKSFNNIVGTKDIKK